MNRQEFWQLMEKCHHADTDIMLEKLAGALAEVPEEINAFSGYLGAYLGCVNECVWVDMACKVINGYVSDDTGLYFALWLIAQGEKAVHDALANPDSLAELAYIPFGHGEFEMLMTIGMSEEADYEATGETAKRCSREVVQAVVYKGGSKFGDYESFEEAMEDIPGVLPRLIQRAEKEGFDWKGLYG